MKQEILCLTCKGVLRKLFPTDTPYSGEHVKFVDGQAIKDFICDYCGKKINKDANCCAFSIWAEYHGIPYYPWESEYLNL